MEYTKVQVLECLRREYPGEDIELKFPVLTEPFPFYFFDGQEILIQAKIDVYGDKDDDELFVYDIMAAEDIDITFDGEYEGEDKTYQFKAGESLLTDGDMSLVCQKDIEFDDELIFYCLFDRRETTFFKGRVV